MKGTDDSSWAYSDREIPNDQTIILTLAGMIVWEQSEVTYGRQINVRPWLPEIHSAVAKQIGQAGKDVVQIALGQIDLLVEIFDRFSWQDDHHHPV